MAEFLIESYISRANLDGGTHSARHVQGIADQLTREGRPVALVRVTAIPEEETCFYVFRADSSGVALEAAERAGLIVERVVETLPEWTPSRDLPTENLPQQLS